jgi:hypothetical protein
LPRLSHFQRQRAARRWRPFQLGGRRCSEEARHEHPLSIPSHAEAPRPPGGPTGSMRGLGEVLVVASPDARADERRLGGTQENGGSREREPPFRDANQVYDEISQVVKESNVQVRLRRTQQQHFCCTAQNRLFAYGRQTLSVRRARDGRARCSATTVGCGSRLQAGERSAGRAGPPNPARSLGVISSAGRAG